MGLKYLKPPFGDGLKYNAATSNIIWATNGEVTTLRIVESVTDDSITGLLADI